MNIAPTPIIDEQLDRKAQVALLVDGENVTVGHADNILETAKQQGSLRIRRVYGNAALLTGWGIEPRLDLIHTHTGKNSADMKLAIDAVDLAVRGLVQQFVLVSSDGDFYHLARYLRERGYRVTGMGGQKTPDVFRQTCDNFVAIKTPDRSEPALAASALNHTELSSILNGISLSHAVVEILRRECGTSWVEAKKLDTMIGRHLNVKIATHPEKNWNGYLTKRGNMFECEGQGPGRRFRLRQSFNVGSSNPK